jgi:hypothetical protein
MFLQFDRPLSVENLRSYPSETVEELRQLLASGVVARPDPHRNDFYEIGSGPRVFYIHLSPVSGKVVLLGTWLKDAQPRGQVLAAGQEPA